MKICELSGGDTAEYLELRREGIAHFPEFMLMSLAELETADPEILAAQLDGGGMFGAFDHDRLVGFAGIVQMTWQIIRHRAEIGPFYVSPDHQGHGVAKGLLTALLSWARVQNVTQVELSVAKANTRAIAFYQREGFVKWGQLPNAAGAGCDDLFFWRAVEPDPLAR